MIRITPAAATITAFLAIVLLGGGNGVAVRFSNQELAPFSAPVGSSTAVQPGWA